MSVAGEFENLHAFVHVEPLSLLVKLDVAQTSDLMLPPLTRHSVEKVIPDLAVELVDVHRIDTPLQAPVFGLEPLCRLLVLAPFVLVASVQRLAHPFQNLFVEVKLAEYRRELPFQHFLADVFAAALSGFTSAFVGITGAVIVGVLLLLDLADHRTAALDAGDQTRE